MLTFADFLRDEDPTHNGRLTPSMFEGWSAARLQAFLTAQVTRAYERADVAALAEGAVRDGAAGSFVYWQAFDAAVLELANAPESADIERLGAVRHDRATQIRTMTRERDRYERAFLDAVDPPVTARRRRITSGSVDIVRH